MAKAWFLYVIECADGSLYTGIAVDVAKRYQLHAAGKGARYTRSHPPLRLLASIECTGRSAASKAEYLVKQLTIAGKRELCRLHPMPGPDQATRSTARSPAIDAVLSAARRS